jgi:transposase
MGMLKPITPAQHELKMVTLEQLVPKDHLLRLIDRHIRFDFIREEAEHLYCADNGRPAIDPVQLFKMLFIGYLFGIYQTSVQRMGVRCSSSLAVSGKW